MNGDMQWKPETWQAINDAVLAEAERITIGKLIIPHVQTTPNAMTMPADRIDSEALEVDETDIVSIIEITVGFSMTISQYMKEEEIPTAVTLATQTENRLVLARDVLIFQGEKGFQHNPLFKSKKVRVTNIPRNDHRNGPRADFFGPGLFGVTEQTKQIIPVEPVVINEHDPTLNRYGENTYGAVSKAYSLLQSKGQSGPYSLVFFADQFADSNNPLPSTLITPAVPIKELIADHVPPPASTGLTSNTVRFYGTGTLPPFTGVLISWGGNSVDLVLGMDPIAEQLSDTTEGRIHFRVYDRFAVRIKVPEAIVGFDFIH